MDKQKRGTPPRQPTRDFEREVAEQVQRQRDGFQVVAFWKPNTRWADVELSFTRNGNAWQTVGLYATEIDRVVAELQNIKKLIEAANKKD